MACLETLYMTHPGHHGATKNVHPWPDSIGGCTHVRGQWVRALDEHISGGGRGLRGQRKG
jgi:hypothetical protein